MNQGYKILKSKNDILNMWQIKRGSVLGVIWHFNILSMQNSMKN